MNFGSGPVELNGRSLFVARYDALSQPLWHLVAPVGESVGLGPSIAVDSLGGLVVGGQFRGSLHVGANAITTKRSEGFLFRLGADGGVTWLRAAGVVSSVTHVATLGERIIAIGTAQGNRAFGLTSNATSETGMFLIALDARGQSQWLVGDDSHATSTGAGLAVAGSTIHTATDLAMGLDGGGSDIVVQSWDINGRQIGTPWQTHGAGVGGFTSFVAVGNGELMLTGLLDGPLLVDDIELRSGSLASFVVTLR